MGRTSSGAKKAPVKVSPFSATDTGDFRQMSDSEMAGYMAKQGITATQQAAFDDYTNPNTMFGSLYNFSQNMNWHHLKGQPMSAAEQKCWDEVNGAMHNIGYNAELTRYDHAGTVNELLNQLGVSGDASSMSLAKLKKSLVGVEYQDDRILSTSVNNFKNSSDPSTFTTRQFKITYKAKASTQGVMPGVGKTPMKGSGKTSGDDFGEMLLSPNSKYKIVDVKYSGAKARKKGGSKYHLPLKQIELVVEVN